MTQSGFESFRAGFRDCLDPWKGGVFKAGGGAATGCDADFLGMGRFPFVRIRAFGGRGVQHSVQIWCGVILDRDQFRAGAPSG